MIFWSIFARKKLKSFWGRWNTPSSLKRDFVKLFIVGIRGTFAFQLFRWLTLWIACVFVGCFPSIDSLILLFNINISPFEKKSRCVSQMCLHLITNTSNDDLRLAIIVCLNKWLQRNTWKMPWCTLLTSYQPCKVRTNHQRWHNCISLYPGCRANSQSAAAFLNNLDKFLITRTNNKGCIGYLSLMPFPPL